MSYIGTQLKDQVARMEKELAEARARLAVIEQPLVGRYFVEPAVDSADQAQYYHILQAVGTDRLLVSGVRLGPDEREGGRFVEIQDEAGFHELLEGGWIIPSSGSEFDEAVSKWVLVSSLATQGR